MTLRNQALLSPTQIKIDNIGRQTVLKKAAIVTGGVAAGLVAFSPVALAGDHDVEGGGQHFTKVFEANDAEENEANAGLVNVSDNNLLIPIQACNNNVPVNVLAVQVPVQDIAGVLGLFGDAEGNDASNDDSCAQEADLDD